MLAFFHYIPDKAFNLPQMRGFSRLTSINLLSQCWSFQSKALSPSPHFCEIDPFSNLSKVKIAFIDNFDFVHMPEIDCMRFFGKRLNL
jgi:hypothetical protein